MDAPVGSTNTESLLSAAGLVVRTLQTDRQKQIYAALPAYKVERATVKNKVFYVYKDEKAGVAYVGREAEYQRYQQLAVQIAQVQYMAAELDRQAALNFYGGFGVRRIWINTFIGRRPIMAFGNSDGDQQMLEWTTAGSGVRFALIVHHDDSEREWAYDRKSQIGKLDKAWDEAVAKGWTVISMKDDWKTIFPATAQ